MIPIDYRDARPIYLQIAEGFREQIRSGVLRSGERLPSVRELAQKLAINPNTIQRAYRELEMEGWIATVPGKGCFVCPGSAALEQEKLQLLERFDQVTARLLAMGMTESELTARMGGKCNA